MKISTKARYGLRALVDLAIHSGGEQVALQHIAKRQELSIHYLEQVFSLLKKTGVVKSVKGAQGGYILAKAPCAITIGDILRAIEGEMAIVEEENFLDAATPIQRNMQQCIQQNVWDKVTESVCNVIDHMTLEDLMKDYELLTMNESLMYYI
ncbi:Rrf2 family transcriptional regulator [Sporanaerobium hydrogeniformans]|uniref:Rrf2 family transcriptional regulator n=1 Tax=Sporanaerobium hydrogeniformans TaxID=3072179 RepID=A0AC61DHN3_9FIRM|nr:Rrf2 family transcriptional regulator [Sporanaerobium hydrogeniformans]PHV72305.1 Rrf2 family transcriptional regulator [Sporanaerobium hydrogeniformans]